MALRGRAGAIQAPEWFGSAARGNAFLPSLMGAYSILYSAWWPFAWGSAGAVAFLLVLAAAVLFIVRGTLQVRHATLFPNNPTPEDQRISNAMGLLNSITHPIWMLGAILLLVFGQGRWVLPLMVFVIGAHFIPMGRIFGRQIDYVLGPIAMAAAVVAGVLARDDEVSWLVVFAVAGVGGTLATLSYAFYMTRAYLRLCERAGVPFPLAKSAVAPG
ncbi:hypothetical protein NF556_15160 [Ornithinimicrobium faecis]|uniref:Uncharacterized protein n=1 Tax=Ornithinimicrobium faecis TaxID=2934158 RepID=A0ABY4YQB4_9MICO|nr:hypothetical protein [Ornithinimicrobium sp. HY1793]USQ78954.1 hypothetical protein NF556_15160 [Ornithinimicrobium sp. HY1793]